MHFIIIIINNYYSKPRQFVIELMNNSFSSQTLQANNPIISPRGAYTDGTECSAQTECS